MVKYDEGFKQQVVDAYLAGEGGYLAKIYEENNGNYGYRKIDLELRKRGYIVNHKKILRITNKLGITCTKFTRKSRKFSMYKGTV